MKSLHTPGPWDVAECNESVPLPAGYPVSIHKAGQRSNESRICDMAAQGDQKYDPDVTWANAHLIAAAPDLLETCRRLLDWCEVDVFGDKFPSGYRQEAEKVVAKAEGRIQ